MTADRAVSQVVAIALLVAIVTILAGTIAVYAGSFSDAAGESPPNVVARTTFNDVTTGNGHYLNITHDGGETVETGDVRLAVTGAETTGGGSASVTADVIAGEVGSEWTATETVVIDRRDFVDSTGTALDAAGTNLDLADATVRIVFEGNPERSSIMYECEVATPNCANREA